MGLNLEQKQAVVAEVAAQVSSAQAIVIAEYRGLGVAAHDPSCARRRVIRVFIFGCSRTRSRAGPSPRRRSPRLADRWSGRCLRHRPSDPVAVAKVLHDFAKGNDKFVITGRRNADQMMSAKDI